MAARKPVNVAPDPPKTRINLAEQAYERLEELIVACALKPGQSLSIQDLQTMTGFGRTPIHQAVNRLAGDTLIVVRPRHGLQIAPVDLARERLLLHLRRDIERFVIRLAAERSNPTHRNQLLHLARVLRARRDSMTIDDFNRFDRWLDRLIIAAADEPFLEHTLRPLHTISRRIGWIYQTWLGPTDSLNRTIDTHLAVIEAVAARQPDAAAAASDALINVADSMFDTMEREIDPALLDCGIAMLVGH